MLGRLWLADFRNYETADFQPAPEGLTVIHGENGAGKTNLLEAIGYLAAMSSFRGVGNEALVRKGSERAVIRAEVEARGREALLELEIRAQGRDRALVNHQPLRRARDLLGVFRATVFSPDDVGLVKGGPAERRRYLDEILVSLHRRNEGLCAEVEKIVRQRNALLRQAGGGRPEAVLLSTLDVWDERYGEAGESMAAAREELVRMLEPEVAKFYDHVAGTSGEVAMAYRRSWDGQLADALRAARDQDLQRGVTTVGPHRDELALWLGWSDSRPDDRLTARAQASRGEQRCLALALRLGAHAVVVGTTGDRPVLLLDDVFSELDAHRNEALLALFSTGQALLTTTGAVPAGARPARTVEVRDGRVLPVPPMDGTGLAPAGAD
jgi:DNA replication and repair protein RecF